MPSSRQARRMRSAISPRLAMTTFSSMEELLFDDEERLAEFDRIAVLHQDRRDASRFVRFDLVHHLHGFDDAQSVADVHFAADVDECLRARRRGDVERT